MKNNYTSYMSKIDFKPRTDCRQGSVGGIEQGFYGK